MTVCANLAPVLESAKADGTSLVLTYAEDLDTSSVPLPGAYSVRVAGGAGPAVSSVSVSGTTVTLTLAAAVTAGPAVTVTYTPQPGAGRIGPRCAAPHRPRGRHVDTTPPIPASAEVPASGALNLTFNENLDIGPGNRAFTVKRCSPWARAPGRTISSWCWSTIKQGQTAGGLPATAGDRWGDFAVDNNSTVEGTPPVPATRWATISPSTRHLDIGPGKLPPASDSAFIVTVS